ncbi:hypothetical protein GGR52DRAFT_389012 [Hypoxylon sp. FL1284]|nr:hypothetical protein GGR52DRAFT_389012 [Hypoxylon sp. FL1284]
MSETPSSRVLIIGAGCVGTVTGYYLSLGGADVTFLVRTRRVEELKRPQLLYCYEDNTLKEYKDYKTVTGPEIGSKYDYIVVALDGTTLKDEANQELVKAIGEAARHTDTKIVLCSIFIDLQPWFVEAAGLSGEQVTNGHLDIHAYPPKRVTLPLPPQAPVDAAELLARADFAYSDKLEDAFSVDDMAPAAAQGFADLFNRCGVSRCVVKPAVEYAASINPLLPVFAACELLGWPKFRDLVDGNPGQGWPKSRDPVDGNPGEGWPHSRDPVEGNPGEGWPHSRNISGNSPGEVWSLAVAAAKEIQGLAIHGEPGRLAAGQTTEQSLATALAAWESQMLPLDLQQFNRFHHAVKLRSQGRAHLRICLAYGEAEGKKMAALKELLRRVDN